MVTVALADTRVPRDRSSGAGRGDRRRLRGMAPPRRPRRDGLPGLPGRHPRHPARRAVQRPLLASRSAALLGRCDPVPPRGERSAGPARVRRVGERRVGGRGRMGHRSDRRTNPPGRHRAGGGVVAARPRDEPPRPTVEPFHLRAPVPRVAVLRMGRRAREPTRRSSRPRCSGHGSCRPTSATSPCSSS